MSLIKYNTEDSLEPIRPSVNVAADSNNVESASDRRNSGNLAIVYRNRDSNQVVLYNDTSKEFQIVKQNRFGNGDDDLSSRRRSFAMYLENRLDEVDDRDLKHLKKMDQREMFLNNNNNDNNNNSNNNDYNWTSGESSMDDIYICTACGSYNHLSKRRHSSHHYEGKLNRENEKEDDEGDDDLSHSNANSDIVTIDSNKSIEHSWNPDSKYKPYTFSRSSNGDLIRGDYFKLLANSMHEKQEPLLTDGNNGSHNYSFEAIPERLINQGYFNKFFRILSKLGSGSFGSVYKVEHELLGLNLGIFALKKIPIGDDVNNLKKILNEVKFLYDISCNFSDNNYNNNNVVKYNHVWVEIDQVSRFTPKIPVVFLLFEYCDGGTLEDWVESIINPKINLEQEKILRRKHEKDGILKKQRFLNNYEIFKIFNDVTQGLNYLHSLNILHRDLKPSNCLFKTKFANSYSSSPVKTCQDLEKIPTVVVSDFGESIMVSSMEDNLNATVNVKATGATGTLEFCAPEIILERRKVNSVQNLPKFGGFSFASDIYSLGMILYFLCFGDLPFSKNRNEPEDICSEILSKNLFNKLYTLRPLVSNLVEIDESETGILIDWVQLIEQMVSKDPQKRPDISTIMDQLIGIYQKLDIRNECPDYKPMSKNDGAKSATDLENSLAVSVREVGKQNHPFNPAPPESHAMKHQTEMVIFVLSGGNLYLWTCMETPMFHKMGKALANMEFLIIGLWMGARITNSNMVIIQLVLFALSTIWIVTSQ